MTRRFFLGVIALTAAAGRLVHGERRYWPQVDGAHQTGWRLLTDGWRPGYRLRHGDLFTISHARPIKTYVVTADVTADSDGRAEIQIHPPIILWGHYRNVDEAPANNAMVVPGWVVPADWREATPWP